MLENNPDVTIIGVTNEDDGDDRKRQQFIEQMKVQIPHVLDGAAEVWAEYGVTSQPSMVFVNADGTFERRLGRHDPPELLDLANELLSYNT